MIKISAIGNIGNQPELKFTQGGTAVLNFSIASNSKRDNVETVTWLRCAIFGKRAESLAQILQKGEKIAVFGSLEQREYQGQNGKGTSLDVVLDDVGLLGNKPSEQATAPAGNNRPAQTQQQPRSRAPWG